MSWFSKGQKVVVVDDNTPGTVHSVDDRGRVIVQSQDARTGMPRPKMREPYQLIKVGRKK